MKNLLSKQILIYNVFTHLTRFDLTLFELTHFDLTLFELTHFLALKTYIAPYLSAGLCLDC